MPFVTVGNYVPADVMRKRLGKPNMCGWFMCGWSECGDDNPVSGVYQQRRHRRWNGAGGFISEKRPLNFVMKPAWPVQPPSAARDAQQAKFKTALAMWQALTEEEKLVYNRNANRRSKRGYDVFMSETLKSL